MVIVGSVVLLPICVVPDGGTAASRVVKNVPKINAVCDRPNHRAFGSPGKGHRVFGHANNCQVRWVVGGG